MQPTKVRQLMNLLSQKYFGSELSSHSSKPDKSRVNNLLENEQSDLNILSLARSNKSSSKLNRISSSHVRRNQNFSYFDDERQICKMKPLTALLKQKSIKLELKESNQRFSLGQNDQNQNGVTNQTFTIKQSQKDPGNNPKNSHISSVQNKNFSSRLPIQKQPTKNNIQRGLFLKLNTVQEQPINKAQEKSTVSNSRSSNHLEKQELGAAYNNKLIKQKENQQLLYYKQKCKELEQQNLLLRAKVTTYDEQFREQKIIVQNLENMISKRQQQINQVVEKRIWAYQQKQQLFYKLQAENQVLKDQLNQVNNILKQQESIIMQLYAKHKQNGQNKQIVTNPYIKKALLIDRSSRTTLLSPNTNNVQNNPYTSSNPNSIQETCYEEG